ncbi:hypothetical protein D3C71_1735500 [compost metagenome]
MDDGKAAAGVVANDGHVARDAVHADEQVTGLQLVAPDLVHVRPAEVEHPAVGGAAGVALHVERG